MTPTPPDNISGGSFGGGLSKPSYSSSIHQAEYGTVTVSPKTSQKGDKVTIDPTPEEGFTVDEIIVTGPNGKQIAVTYHDDGTYIFTQPAGKVIIKSLRHL